MHDQQPSETAALLPATAAAAEDVENPDRPTGFKFAIVYASILMGDLLIGYDTSCVATLSPPISDEFRAIDDVAWYEIAYTLALASSILTFGQLYNLYSNKTIFLTCFVIFAVGSAVSATSPSSAIFIIGRAISGLGASGIFAGSTIIVANTTPLKHRPIYLGISGGVETVALAIGPLAAGAIANGTSWRTAFYVLIPVVLVNVAIMWTFVPQLPRPRDAADISKHWYKDLDLLGILLFVLMTVCLVLTLQWGGSTYEWGEPRIIVLLVAMAIFAASFVTVEHRQGDKAMLPLRMLKHKSVMLGSLAQFSVSASLFVFAIYIPVYFQAVRGASTLESGLQYLPTAAALAVSVSFAGSLTSWIGYYTPAMAIGTVLMAVGAGVLTTLHPTTPSVPLISYQITFGLGCGLFFQQSMTAVQTVLAENDVNVALVVLSFIQQLGGIVALAISQNIFLSTLVSKLSILIPGLDTRSVLDKGAVSLLDSVPPKYRQAAIEKFSEALRSVWIVGLVCACLTVCALGIEWRSVKEGKKDNGSEDLADAT